MFVLGLIGVIIGAYKAIFSPTEDIEKKQAVNDERDKSKATVLAQKEMENKAALLEQQVKLAFEANEKKFADIMTRMDTNTALAQNHIHTVDTKVDVLKGEVADLKGAVIRLTTIIEERIPKKN